MESLDIQESLRERTYLKVNDWTVGWANGIFVMARIGKLVIITSRRYGSGVVGNVKGFVQNCESRSRQRRMDDHK